MHYLHYDRRSIIPLLLSTSFFLTTVVIEANARDGFSIIEGVKCSTYSGADDDPAFKRIVVEKSKDCWDICDKKKKCAIAQMDEQANECSLFARIKKTTGASTKCSWSSRAEGFKIAGKRTRRMKGFFHLPGYGACHAGSEQIGYKSFPSGSEQNHKRGLKRCLKKCAKDADCVAARLVLDAPSLEEWFCQWYKTCKGVVIRSTETSDLYIKEGVKLVA